MDILSNYQFLLFSIALFLLVVVLLPFVFKEFKKKKEAGKLINRVIPVNSLTEQDLQKIESLHPEGKKMHPSINTSICVGCGSCVLSCKEKDALYLLNGKSTLVNPFACKSRGDCERQCPTGALTLLEYGKRMKVKIPETDQHFESNIKGIYIVGALTGAGLIKEAINQGRAAVNHIMKDVFPPDLPEVVVVGAGPAGLSALLSLRKFGLNAVCLEKEHAANTIKNFPKKKILMAEPVDMPIFGPLWVGDTTREELLDVWERILDKTGVRITTDARVEMIEKKDNRFIVSVPGKQYTCDNVILAMGNRGIPRKLGVPGEQLETVFYNLLDAEEFSGSSVTVVGAGDSAIEAALSLHRQKCRIRLIVRGEGFPRAKAKNREKIHHAVRSNEITVHYNSHIKSIESGFVSITGATGTSRVENDNVFIMVGGELPFQLLERIGIHIVEKEI